MESLTKCFEHLRSPLKKTRAWLRCKKIENCKVKLEYWNLHPTELLKVEWLLAKMLAIKNARDHFASKIRADLDHGASKMRADHWSRSRSARAMLAINVHMILSPTVPVLWQEKVHTEVYLIYHWFFRLPILSVNLSYFWGAATNDHFNNWYLIKTVQALLKFVHEHLCKSQSVFGEHLKSWEDQTHKSTCHVHVMR